MNEPKDLRLTGRSVDGSELELVDLDGNQYNLRISDTLRAYVNQPRLSAVSDIEEAVTTSVKEVQARLRAGETIDAISRTTDWSIEKIENYAGPILQERAFIISQALATQIRREPHAPYLETAVANQLAPRGVDMNSVEWNTFRKPDGNWNLTLYYPIRDGAPNEAKGEAVWIFNLGRRALSAHDDGARWIGGEAKVKQPVQTYGNIPQTEAPRLVSIKEDVAPYSPTKLASVEEVDVDDEAKRDGVTKRIKIPSWDDIMFGKKDED
ncbi:MAG: DUF3071 domain-containing protein [Actinobacteria bacterium]|nr:DUF3071 domain-containing protein [Actinomycetota bacterium]